MEDFLRLWKYDLELFNSDSLKLYIQNVLSEIRFSSLIHVYVNEQDQAETLECFYLKI